MDVRVLQHSIFLFLFWTLFFSDTINAQKPPTTEIRQMDVAPGSIPIFNPTSPTSNVNPTIPRPPYPTVPQPPNPTVQQPATNIPTTQGGSWCIANPTASQTALQVALDYACGYGGADCSAIQTGGTCYNPNTFKDHVSYAFNDYYQKKPTPTSCVFGGTAQLSSTDPSYGNCHYASSTRTNTPTPTLTIPVTPSPPSTTTTPVNPYTPGGSTSYGTQPTGYGSEPTGMPNSANIALQKLTISALLLLVASNSI